MPYDFVFANAQRFELSSDLDDTTTSISAPTSVVTAAADALTNGARMPFVLADTAVIKPDTTFEVVYATDVETSTDSLIVTRGEEGTNAQSWPSGTVVQNALTGGALNQLPKLGMQHTFLPANSLLDATDASSEVTIDVPSGWRFWSWYVHGILRDYSNSGTRTFAATGLGTTSNGNELMGNYELGANEVPQRAFLYIDNREVPVTGTMYAWIDYADDSVTTALWDIYVEGMMEKIT